MHCLSKLWQRLYAYYNYTATAENIFEHRFVGITYKDILARMALSTKDTLLNFFKMKLIK